MSPAPPVSTFGGTQVLRPDVVRGRPPLVSAYLLGLPGEAWGLGTRGCRAPPG